MVIPWGEIINAGVQVGTAVYGAKQAKKGAKRAAAMATPVPYSATSQYGTTTWNPKTHQMELAQAQNPFSQMLNIGGQQSLANAYSAPGQAYFGAAPEVAQAAGAMFGPGQDAAAAERLGVLRQLAQPEEQRTGQSLNDRLFAMGQMGTSGGGIQQEAFYKAQQDADLKRQLASQDWAQSRSMDRFNTAIGAVNQGQAGQSQAFNIGQQSQSGLANMFQQLLQQGQLGVGGAAGAPPQLAAAANQSIVNSTILPALQQSGVFDRIGGWLGGAAQPAATAPGSVGPMAGGYATGPGVNLPQQPAQYQYNWNAK